jgi:2-oxoglutarate dehydrogenase E2 component (dihydrolipoamide succinyltransferase)
MPQLGETVTEGTITRWHKHVGDPVSLDEVLFEVSTDKVDSEVPSPFAGQVSEILVEEGETVDVGTRLAVIAGEGAVAATPAQPEAAQSEAAQTEAAQTEAAQTEAAQAESSQAESAQSRPAAEAAPPAEREPVGAPAAQSASPASSGAPTTSPGLPAAAAPPAPASPPGPPAEPAVAARAGAAEGEAAGNGSGAPLVLSPVVRRLLAENGLNPADIPGTGLGGRITRDDVLAHLDARSAGAPGAAAPAPAPPAPAQAPPAPAAAPARAPARAPEPVAAGERDEVIPFSTIRRRTAEHMVRSKATSAHTLVACEADFEAVERVRTANRDRFRAEEGFSLTYLPFVAMATVEALRAFPRLNASVGDDTLIVHRDLHLAIAVDMDHEGLVAPVIHSADGKRLRALAREIADLASRARSRRLTPDDIAGGTFTITNAGIFGTFITVPIINQPQIGILSTDGVKRRPVVVNLEGGGEGIAIHSVGMLALSFDHRAVDGAYAAAFLAKVREVIEGRDWANEL